MNKIKTTAFMVVMFPALYACSPNPNYVPQVELECIKSYAVSDKSAEDIKMLCTRTKYAR